MRTGPVTATTALLLIVAGCTSSDNSSERSEPVAPIEYTTGPDEVLIQVGDYNFGWPDEFLVGPEIVVYGDGRVFAELRDPSPADASQRRPVMGELDDATIQPLLRSAEAMPTDLSVGDRADDSVPTLPLMNDRQWELGEDASEPLATLLTKVRDVVDDMPSTEWVPEQWTVRINGNDCTLSAAPITPSLQSAPIFPHLFGTDPFADVDCGG